MSPAAPFALSHHSRRAGHADGAEGTEVIIGVSRDPIFGPVMMFGLGGIFVEILEDVAFRRSRCRATTRVRWSSRSRRARFSRVRVAKRRSTRMRWWTCCQGLEHRRRLPCTGRTRSQPDLAYDDGYAVVDARVIVNWAI